MLIRVDPSAEAPLFEQLATAVRAAVISGEATAGERLPSARDLAESLAINVHTVLRAYQELRDEGLIELRRGRGAVIVASPRSYDALNSAIGTAVAEAKKLDLPPAALAALIREAYQ